MISLKDSYPRFWWSFVIMLLIFIVIVMVSYFVTLNDRDVIFCLKSQCVDYFVRRFNGTLLLIKGGVYILGFYLTCCGVYLALANYLVSVKSSSLSGYVSHLNLFRSYVESELEKSSGLEIRDIDIFKWYKLLFPDSLYGDITPSKHYSDFLEKVSNVIEVTSRPFLGHDAPKYCYKDHQGRMIGTLSEVGISIGRMPKNDFFEVESQVLEIVDSVSMTFAEGVDEKRLIQLNRAYL